MEKYERIYSNGAGLVFRVDNSTYAIHHYSMKQGARVCTLVDYSAVKECIKDVPNLKIHGIDNEWDLLIYRLQF